MTQNSRSGTGCLGARGDQHEGDDTHGLLGVVGAVREGHEAGGEDLAGAEAAALLRELAARFRVVAGGQRIGKLGAQVGHGAGDDRRENRGQDHLLHEALEVDRVDADARDGGADQAAEKRVRGTRRQALEPRDHVPEDGAHQSGEDDVRGDLDPVGPFLDDAAGHGLGHFRGEEGPHQVQHRREGDSRFGFDGTGCDGRGHRVGGVMESVGEVKKKRQRYNQRHHDGDFHLLPNLQSRRSGVSFPAAGIVHPGYTGRMCGVQQSCLTR